MNERLKYLSQEAQKLTSAERAELADELLESLNESDATLDALWTEEADRRLDFIDQGEMPVRDAAEVIAEIRRLRSA